MPFKDKRKQREYQRNYCRRRRQLYIKKLGGRCIKCGSTRKLEFHHRIRRFKKCHKIWSWSRKRLQKELKKCDLLCRRCHKKETARERRYGTAKHGTLTAYKNYNCRCQDCRLANANYEHRRRRKL